jgi:segregation and condensation protein A
VTFDALFAGATTRFDIVITFLALLEMSKLRMTRLFQTEPLAPIYVELATVGADAEEAPSDAAEPTPPQAPEAPAATEQPPAASPEPEIEPAPETPMPATTHGEEST